MRVAVFVDAGYVYAQGSSAITGLKTPRSRDAILLDEIVIVEQLKAYADEISKGKELLRIYWYDGAPSNGPSDGQKRIGQLDDVKLRLGQLNSEGQQKGVDSLIVTDLMELARNKAIGDAVVVTGDEDIRVGVQIAQSLGVRVHLLGIGGPKSSQSHSLLQEADTVVVWSKPKVSTFLNIQGTAETVAPKQVVVKTPAKPAPAQPLPMVRSEFISGAVQRAYERLMQHSDKLKLAINSLSKGKELPGPIVSILKTELTKFDDKVVTKREHKIARDELSKKITDAR